MIQLKSTPVPNVLFDVYLKELKTAELKILLTIIRQTLGWADRRAYLGRKEMDWISCSQLQSKTGCSRRAISSAIETLVKKELIEVLDEKGNFLNDPSMRKGKQRLFYRPSTFLISPVENMGTNCAYHPVLGSVSANFAQDLNKKITALAQKMRITKETLQN